MNAWGTFGKVMAALLGLALLGYIIFLIVAPPPPRPKEIVVEATAIPIPATKEVECPECPEYQEKKPEEEVKKEPEVEIKPTRPLEPEAKSRIPERVEPTVPHGCPVFGGFLTRQLDDGGCKFGPIEPGLTADVPQGWWCYYWNGRQTKIGRSGETIFTNEATFYRNSSPPEQEYN